MPIRRQTADVFHDYGSSAGTNDRGETWQASKSSHLDFGSVDWSDSGKCLIAIRHESGGKLTLSKDAGQTWEDLGAGFTKVGIFDAEHLMLAKKEAASSAAPMAARPGTKRLRSSPAAWHANAKRRRLLGQ